MKSLQKLLYRKQYYAVPLKITITNHLQIKAIINGVKGRFILDTGASNSCVGMEYIKRFNLNAEDSEEKAAGAGTTAMETKQSSKNTINIGQWELKNCHLILFDLTHINTALQKQKAKKVHGIIGADMLKKGKGIIDYKSRLLYLKKIKQQKSNDVE